MISHAISVQVRVRPHKPSDGTYATDGIILGERSASVPNSQDSGQRLRFGLDAVYGPESTQEDVFEQIKPLVEQVYKGINTTVFAYGVTGSGKTWTMQGTKEDQGIIPRVVKAIFLKKARLRKSSLKISFSYVEILIEEVYDLLAPLSTSSTSSSASSNTNTQLPHSSAAQGQARPKLERKRLDIRTTSSGENVIAGLERREVGSVGEFEGFYNQASQSRKTAATSLNSSSSRSHAILTIYVETTEHISSNTTTTNGGAGVEGQGKTSMGKICLVDLAGSEDNKLTGNDPVRMRESSAINRSLTNLGNVVEALNTGAGRVPYRDSKLTRILQDALGGSSIGMLICNLAPGEKFAKDTLRSLKFASRTKEIENKVVVNERDDRVLPKPRFSAPSRPQVKTSLVPSVTSASGAVSHNPLQARPPLVSVKSASTNLPKAGQPALLADMSMMTKVRSQISVTGIALTDDQLTSKIEDIVKQVMEQKEKKHTQPAVESVVNIQPEAGPSRARQVAENAGVTSILSEEEIKARAKVLVNLGRQHQDEGDIVNALLYYTQAKAYIPDNKKLSARITELELASEGQVPLRQRAGAKAKEPVGVEPEPEPPKAGMKRSKAMLGTLAEVTNGLAEQPAAVVSLKSEKHAGKALPKSKASQNGQTFEKLISEDKENRMARPYRAPRPQPKRKQLMGGDSDASSSSSDQEDEYIPQQPVAKKPKRKLALRMN